MPVPTTAFRESCAQINPGALVLAARLLVNAVWFRQRVLQDLAELSGIGGLSGTHEEKGGRIESLIGSTLYLKLAGFLCIHPLFGAPNCETPAPFPR